MLWWNRTAVSALRCLSTALPFPFTCLFRVRSTWRMRRWRWLRRLQLGAIRRLSLKACPPFRYRVAWKNRAGQDFLAVVDYAHKPAAVAAVLDTLRQQATGRIGVVLGAGGDRDAEKRPLMGTAAAERADLVIITDDNPPFRGP